MLSTSTYLKQSDSERLKLFFFRLGKYKQNETYQTRWNSITKVLERQRRELIIFKAKTHNKDNTIKCMCVTAWSNIHQAETKGCKQRNRLIKNRYP